MSRYIAHRLQIEPAPDSIVVELGAGAKRRKLKRTFRQASWWQYPGRCLDLAAVAAYSRRAERHLKEALLDPTAIDGFPSSTRQHEVEDANADASLELLRELAPDVLLVFGTSILSASVLEIPKRHALNIHTGIVPAYRNVHSDFWAVQARDYENVGVSIIHLDPGIDSGDLALQGRIAVDTNDSIFDIKLKLARLAGDLALEAIRRARADNLPRTPQDEGAAGFYPTPGAGDLIRYFLSRG